MRELLQKNSSWHAKLRLEFADIAGCTKITKRSHQGPLQVQRPFYPEVNGTCHVYVLHPPGGIVSGDHLDVNIHVKGYAKTLITTPAAGKFYRSNGEFGYLHQNLSIESKGILEWFPQETIIFNGALAESRTVIKLFGNARFMGWEIVCFGRPAANEIFNDGLFKQNFEIYRDGQPLWIDRSRVAHGDFMNATWGMMGYTVIANFVCVGARKDHLDMIRKATEHLVSDDLFGVTLIKDVLVCKYLGFQAEQAKQYFLLAWEILRPHHSQRIACPPRIWAT